MVPKWDQNHPRDVPGEASRRGSLKRTSPAGNPNAKGSPRADFERTWDGFGRHFGKNDFERGYINCSKRAFGMGGLKTVRKLEKF